MSYTIRLHKTLRHERQRHIAGSALVTVRRWEWKVSAHNRLGAYGTTHTRRGAIRQAKRFIRQDKATPCPWTTYKGKVS